MALRVARGLFRLWLVLSVLWIGGVAVETWRHFPFDLLLTPGKAPPGEFDPDTFLARDLPDFDASNPSKQYVLVREKERRSAIWHASLLAFLPPAFLLALGSAVVWAFRGFRQP
jgi:hypothetical protein